MEAATAAAWAQAVFTGASAVAAVILIHQERGARHTDAARWELEQARRREDQDRATMREVGLVGMHIGASGAQGEHLDVEVLIDNRGPLGFVRCTLLAQLDGTLAGVTAVPLRIEDLITDLGPGQAVRRRYTLPWRDDHEWTWAMVLEEPTGARWNINHNRFVKRVDEKAKGS